MPVEGDHGGGQILLGRHPLYPFDHQSVPDVDAVVGADRHRAGAARRAVAGVVEDLHRGEGYGASSDSVEPGWQGEGASARRQGGLTGGQGGLRVARAVSRVARASQELVAGGGRTTAGFT